MPLLLKFRQWVKRAVPDAIGMFIVNRNLKRRLEAWETAHDFDDIRALNTDQLEKYLETEWTRAKELDEKLNKLTAALSVAVTVSGVVSKTIFDGLAATPVKTSIAILLFVSMGMFLFGAVIGFSGLRPKPRYGYGAGYLRIIAQGGDEATKAMMRAASGFQIMNAIRSNEASTAIGLIRNGVVVFTFAIAVSFFAPTTDQTASISPPSVVETVPFQTHDLQPAMPIFPAEMNNTGHKSIAENKLTCQEASLSCEAPSQAVRSEQGKESFRDASAHTSAESKTPPGKDSCPTRSTKCRD